MTADKYNFTPAQEEAFGKIEQLMQEHFDAGVFME